MSRQAWIAVSKNYFDENDANTEPRIRWNPAATTFFSNWIQSRFYQETPYRLEELEKIFHFMVTYKGNYDIFTSI